MRELLSSLILNNSQVFGKKIERCEVLTGANKVEPFVEPA